MKNLKDIIILIVVLFVLYYINTLLKNAGNLKEKLFGDAALNQAQNIAISQGEQQYYNDATLRSYAATIKESLLHGSWFENIFTDDNEIAVYNIMLSMRTTGDVIKLAKYFKEITAGEDLAAQLNSELDYDQVEKIRQHFQNQSINYTI